MTVITFWFAGFFCDLALADVDDEKCMEIEVEISKESVLENQAFIARIQIDNSLDNSALRAVRVDLNFSDANGKTVIVSSDPHQADALFFVRLYRVRGIDSIDGSGTIQASSRADIQWIIIPAIGSSKKSADGTLYCIGADLKYTISGIEQSMEAKPDHILVKSLPRLLLDCFLPGEVFGDDASTSEVEPAVPFAAGLRVKNNGSGQARSVEMDSACLKILQNGTDNPAGFVIERCEINGEEAPPTLDLNLGNINPDGASIACWAMTCPVSGRVVGFDAEFSYSDPDSQGSRLVSGIGALNSHVLVHDVLVDTSEKDAICDFLADTQGLLTVYESDGTETTVTDLSSSASLEFLESSGEGISYSLTVPETNGPVYTRVSDPYGGEKIIKGVIRSDGKYLKPQNAWLSRIRVDEQWMYFIHCFDIDTPGSYRVVLSDPEPIPHQPVLNFIPDQTGMAGTKLYFNVEAGDPDGTIPAVSAEPIPALATFQDLGNGKGIFEWTPAEWQTGRCSVIVTASDGQLKASQHVNLTIRTRGDFDGDGMPDDWEMTHFGSLDRNGTGDFDGDGISDLDEYNYEKDPVINFAPSTPKIDFPLDGSEVFSFTPTLTIVNSTDQDGGVLTYEFEVYSDQEMNSLIAEKTGVAEDPLGKTSWTPPVSLSENNWYHWRVRSTDGKTLSQWAYASFFVNTANQAPGKFEISSPADGIEVSTLQPLLQVTNSTDADGDEVTYSFVIYSDSGMEVLVAAITDIPEGPAGTTSCRVPLLLNDRTEYYWRAFATDEHGAKTEVGASPQPASFIVDTSNHAPKPPAIAYPAAGSETDLKELDLTVTNASDADGDQLWYFFEIDRVDNFSSIDKTISEKVPEGPGGSTFWRIIGLADDTTYYWRVKANDGRAGSPWVQGTFFVNTANDAPSIPTVRNPGGASWVDTLTPTLELNPSIDTDRDGITYSFEVYTDDGLGVPVVEGTADHPGWVISSELTDRTWYFWRGRAEDEHGVHSQWTTLNSFFVKNNGVNDAPVMVLTDPCDSVVTSGKAVVISWKDDDPDSNADISLYYDTDPSGEDGVLVSAGLKEDADGISDHYLFDTSGLSDGTYYIYAVITDGNSSNVSYAPGSIVVDRVPPETTATPPSGTFGSIQDVILSTDEPADIHYTMDGNEPDLDSFLYGSPVRVSRNTILKYMAVDRAGNRSGTATEVYVFDSDNDGLADLIEIAAGTDPSNPDTDGDGLVDGVEDADHDGVFDVGETDPRDADTDDDGLVDGNTGSEDLNANGIVDPGETDPVNPDTDGDGIYDGTEKGLSTPETPDTDRSAGYFVPDADPSSKTDPAKQDSDNDGLLDGEEDKDGNGQVDSGETNPTSVDSDNDGIQDGTELGLTAPHSPDTDLSVFIPDSDPSIITDPTKSDTDTDGLSDGEEDENRNGSGDAGESSPVDNDSDDDGHSDGDEISSGFDPTDPNSSPNDPPVADAGPDQNGITGQAFTLNGSESFDPEGSQLTFSWFFTGMPANSSAALSDPFSAMPTFTPDMDGAYRFRLTVNDGIQDSAPEEVTISTNTPNVAPNADAGPDQNVLVDNTVSVDGSKSIDPDNGPSALSYLWSFDLYPSSAPPSISGQDQFLASFIPDVYGTYVLRLTVNDGELSSVDTVEITATLSNVPPNANAGADVTIYLGQTAVLDGSASNDPDSGPQPLTYQWSFVTVPAGSTITDNDLAGADTANPSFIPDIVGTYVLELMTYDGADTSFDNAAMTVTETDLGPVAVLTGSISLDEGAPGIYDASGSICSPKAIVSYEWDWTFDGTFDTSGDAGVTQSHTWADAGTYTVAVRVTDEDGSTDIDTLVVTVNETSLNVSDLSARTKIGSVQLVWTHVGAPKYKIYRSTTSGGPYSLIATSMTTICSYLDRTVARTTTYYYIVRPAAADGTELGTSNEVSITTP